MNKTWGLLCSLVLGACAVPEASIVPPAAEVATEGRFDGTASLLDEVAGLRATLVRANEARAVLDTARTPYTSWMTDGALLLVTRDLQARRADLWHRGESLLVRASLVVDIDPLLWEMASE